MISQLKTHASFHAALQVAKTLNEQGFKTYLVGGCVRDALLKRPLKDFDLVTIAHPDQVQSLFPRTLSVGKKFGIITVLIDGASIEVATFRKDQKYLDGRRPENVEFSDENEDALRRDFTINALFYDLKNDQVIDYVQGQNDLENKILKTVGDPKQRFAEDHLRLMRLVRFQSQLGFQVESSTWKAFNECLEDVLKVSKERLSSEFQLWMMGDYFLFSLKQLLNTDFFKTVFKDFDQHLDYRKVYYGNSFPWARLILFLQLQDSRKKIYEQMGLSNEVQSYVEEACYWWSGSVDDQAFERVFAPGSRLGLEVAQATGGIAKSFADELLQVGAKHFWVKPKPLVTFSDLPETLQKQPPKAGARLKQLFYEQIKNLINDKKQLLDKL